MGKTEASLITKRTLSLHECWKFVGFKRYSENPWYEKLGRRFQIYPGKPKPSLYQGGQAGLSRRCRIHLLAGTAGLLRIDPFGMRIDFHRITLLILLDRWTVVLLSSLAACMLLSKAGAFSAARSAVSRVPANELGDMGKGLLALGSRQLNTIQILSSKSDLILLCYYKLHWKQCKNS